MSAKLLIALLCLCSVHAMAAAPTALQTIDSLDLPRYLGTWYEIARYPNRFQQQCVANSRADYQQAEDGSITVRNSCQLADGSSSVAIGAARRVGAAGSPRLQVRFAPAWLSALPLVWGNYWVIDLDPDYRLVAVSEPKREYLWILSRTPVVEAGTYNALLARLRQQGFDSGKLQADPQRGTP